jgi:hypothetical protein
VGEGKEAAVGVGEVGDAVEVVGVEARAAVAVAGRAAEDVGRKPRWSLRDIFLTISFLSHKSASFSKA